jgi:hypothetical protein
LAIRLRIVLGADVVLTEPVEHIREEPRIEARDCGRLESKPVGSTSGVWAVGSTFQVKS